MRLSFFALLFMASPLLAGELKQSRELQNLWVRSGFQIGVDSYPAWSWYSVTEPNYDVFVVESPGQFYPPAIMNVRYNKHHPPQSPEGFKKTAYFVLFNMQKKLGSKTFFKYRDITPATYGELTGFEQTSIVYINGEPFSNKAFVGLSGQNKLIVLNAITLPGKIDHLQSALDRMWGSINFLNSSVDKK